jgi:hypothetical protein
MAVGSVGSSASVAAAGKAVQAPPPKDVSPTLPVDKVSISPAAAKLSAGGDSDHDGDSK